VSQPAPEDPGVRNAHESELLTRELERRLEWLSQADEAEFGHFGRLDWWICAALFFVIPILVVWWAA